MSNISFVLFKVSSLHLVQIKRYCRNEAKRFVWWLSVGQIYNRAPPACMFHATFAQIPSIKSDQLNPKLHHPPNFHQLLRNTFPKSLHHLCLHSITSPITHGGFYFFSATSRPLPVVAYINFSKPKRNLPVGRLCCEINLRVTVIYFELSGMVLLFYLFEYLLSLLQMGQRQFFSTCCF